MSAKNANLVIAERTNSGDAGTVGNGTITGGVSDGNGSLISTGQGNGLSDGTIAWGRVASAGTIQAQAYGTLAVGYASDTGIVTTELDGSFAHGRADGHDSTPTPSQISANGVGAQAHGKAYSGGVIGATSDGSSAFGHVTNSGTVYGSGDSSLAHGKAVYGSIEASGIGSHAHGQSACAGSQVLASGDGSLAFGYVNNGYDVKASNVSALAFGVAENEGIEASAQGALAGGFPLDGKVLASGVASVALGDNNTSAARLSVVLGKGNQNDSYCSLMIGSYGSTSGCTTTSWVSTDALFVAGNGSSGSPSNAYHLAKDGRITTTAAQRHISIRSASGTVTVSSRLDRTIVCDTSSSSVTVNLPAAEDGLEYFILDKSNNALAHNITINRNGSDTFQGGGTSEVINTNSGIRYLQALGGVWYILNRI